MGKREVMQEMNNGRLRTLLLNTIEALQDEGLSMQDIMETTGLTAEEWNDLNDVATI